jgi:hypothetical protein
MNVRVSFEVEERGKVVRTFAVNERFSIPDGKADTQDDIARSYQKLVAKYRSTSSRVSTVLSPRGT